MDFKKLFSKLKNQGQLFVKGTVHPNISKINGYLVAPLSVPVGQTYLHLSQVEKQRKKEL